MPGPSIRELIRADRDVAHDAYAWPVPIAACAWARAGGPTAAAALTQAIAAVSRELGSLPAPSRRAIVAGSQSAARAEVDVFASAIAASGAALVNPALFPPTVMNAPAGLAAIDHRCEGPNVTLSNGATSAADALVYAADLLIARRAAVVFAGGFETAAVDRPDRACAFVVALATADGAMEAGWPPRARLFASATGAWPAGADVPIAVEMVRAAGMSDAAPEPVVAITAEDVLLMLEQLLTRTSSSDPLLTAAVAISPAGHGTALLAGGWRLS